MFSKKKGQFKYLKKMPVIQGLVTLGMILLCAAVFSIGYFTANSAKNIMTIVAVLGMLPAAKSMVSMIMYMKAEKNSCSESLYEKIIKVGGENLNNLPCGYDLYMTAYDKTFPIAFCIAKKGCLVGITENKKCDINAAKKHVEEYMAKNGIKDINVKFFDQEDKFISRLEDLLADEEEIKENEWQVYNLIRNLSL